MLTSISPLGERARGQRYGLTVAAHLLGGALGGATTGALLGAAGSRTQTVARQLVIAQWPSVDERLVATLQSLAERWGVMTPDGIVLPDFLTHSVLAPLVGARRPSVTTSLKRLNDTGAVRRRPDGRWLLATSATTAAAA